MKNLKTSALLVMSVFLICGCGNFEKTITSSEAIKIADELPFENANVASASAKVTYTINQDSLMFKDVKEGIQKSLGFENDFDGPISLDVARDKSIQNYSFKNWGDQYYTYKAKGKAISVNFAQHQTVTMNNQNFGQDFTWDLYFDEKGLLTSETVSTIITSSGETCFDMKGSTTYTYTFA